MSLEKEIYAVTESKGLSDAHKTKRQILIDRGIIKADDLENILHQHEMPRGFALNLCGHCNYRCSYCPQSLKKHPVEYIDVEIIEKTFGELGNRAVYVQMGTRGENLLHPSFFRVIDVIKKRNGSSYICLNTNGFLIDEKMMQRLLGSEIDHIVFSLQTIKADLYQKINGSTHHGTIVEKIKKFIKARNAAESNMLLSVQFLGFPENIRYRDDFINYWRGHDIQVQVQPLHCWGDKFEHTETQDEQRYPCLYLWLYPQISHKGRLAMCYNDFYDEMAYGDLSEYSLSALWQGERAKELREKHLSGRWGEIAMCRNCFGYKYFNNCFSKENGKFTLLNNRGEN